MNRLSRTLLFCLPVGATVAPATAQTTIVEAARIIVAPKTIVSGDPARLAIRAGEVLGVGDEIPRDLLSSAKRLSFPGTTVVPGFVIAHDQLTSAKDLAETIVASTPSMRAADAFDPFDESLERLTRGGVTSVGLAPSSANVVGGLGTVVRWQPDGGEVLQETTYLKAALVPEALNQDRYPTSRMGAADLLRTGFRDAAAPLAPRSRDARTLASVLAGGTPLAIHARSRAEIVEALDLCAEFGLRPILLGATQASRCIESLPGRCASVALAPLDLSSSREALELPAALQKAGVEFSFLGSEPARLRQSAALAVRYGLSRDVAVAALTRVPASQLGLQDRIGSLRRGFAADFAIYSGDPLDLTSELVAVFVRGERADTEEPK